jgi:hypothetical protein
LIAGMLNTLFGWCIFSRFRDRFRQGFWARKGFWACYETHHGLFPFLSIQPHPNFDK